LTKQSLSLFIQIDFTYDYQILRKTLGDIIVSLSKSKIEKKILNKKVKIKKIPSKKIKQRKMKKKNI
jgi:hypothetical protein